NELLAKGPNGNNAGSPTEMIGLFIARKVHGNKNVRWNADDLCAPCALPTNPPPAGNNQNNVFRNSFDVESWPNPSDTVFNLKLITVDLNTESKIQVFDMSNKLVHSNTFDPEKVYQFGNKLEAGVYIVKIQQANDSKTIRLVKY
ncbi:MAG: T9SS type A sorting domain-containing protein, partial [Psychroserpens sp.]|uniref:T9SS type A sorting domain-containing protein n=1 Tax=Psychroserpens sp. TaxID=2020870 RepID=UPI0030036E73